MQSRRSRRETKIGRSCRDEQRPDCGEAGELGQRLGHGPCERTACTSRAKRPPWAFVSIGRHSRPPTLLRDSSVAPSSSQLFKPLQRHDTSSCRLCLGCTSSLQDRAARIDTLSHSFANYSRATRVFCYHETAMPGCSCSALLGNSIQDQSIPIRLLQLPRLVNALLNIRRPTGRLPPMLQLQP